MKTTILSFCLITSFFIPIHLTVATPDWVWKLAKEYISDDLSSITFWEEK